MMNDLEQMIKQRLLENLIDKMSDHRGDSMKPKEMAVQVAAPDKDKLAEGLDKAKEVLGSATKEEESKESPSEEEDEQKLMAMLEDEDDEDKK